MIEQNLLATYTQARLSNEVSFLFFLYLLSSLSNTSLMYYFLRLKVVLLWLSPSHTYFGPNCENFSYCFGRSPITGWANGAAFPYSDILQPFTYKVQYSLLSKYTLNLRVSSFKADEHSGQSWADSSFLKF